MKNFYRVLGVEEHVSEQEILSAYKFKIKHYRIPDSPVFGFKVNNSIDKRIALLDEAYGTLSDPQKRQRYDEKLHNPKIKTTFIACRHCGNSEEILLSESKRSFDCLICDMKIELSDTPNSYNDDLFWKQIITLLRSSVHAEDVFGLPTIFKFTSDKHCFSLSYAANEDLYLFAYTKESYEHVLRFIDARAVQEWDVPGQVGLLLLSNNIDYAHSQLERIEASFANPTTKACFSVGHRKQGVSDPNNFFISAMLDIGASSAEKLWLSSDKNLRQAIKQVPRGWQFRLRQSVDMTYGKIRSMDIS